MVFMRFWGHLLWTYVTAAVYNVNMIWHIHMVPRRIGFHLKYVDSTFYTVFMEILGFFLPLLSNWPSLYKIHQLFSGMTQIKALLHTTLGFCQFHPQYLNQIILSGDGIPVWWITNSGPTVIAMLWHSFKMQNDLHSDSHRSCGRLSW
jgi:hypothetical protein